MNSRNRLILIVLPFLLILYLTGCWSSKEIDTLGVYVGLALDIGKEPELEQELTEKGADYPKKNLVTSTIQIIPVQKGKDSQQKGKSTSSMYSNSTETGDSGFQLLRQHALSEHRSIIGHHLKVIVISSELSQKIDTEKLLRFILRDNEIRPSCIVLMSTGKASETLITNQPGDIPAFHLKSLIENQNRSNRILPEITLTKLDGIMNSGASFILQNVISAKGQVEFAGAGVIKGKTNKWIGTLNEQEVEALSWIKGKIKGGLIKTYDKTGEVLAYEIKSVNTKIKSNVEGDDISFHVSIKSEGRLMENWNTSKDPTDTEYLKETEQYFEDELKDMIYKVVHKMQEEYRVDVAGFRDRLRIQHPRVWKKVKEDWDETFSKSEITYDVNLNITDYGSSAK
ncbi:spore germination protein [Paenibacillus anaericanus]|uniref:Ger(x)C family spore germination protein n=1 Tax=Paenibacillus anaericanus TaxID=170367 RepID=UPI00278114CE|nr:Ger(x)C family spore germination protein [Paenibacillus anaericanus]MDQ0087752.1 spore germination protein [Paenibacillus anaericanus]